ncbi:hypothetical protein TWF694_002993 [Orbilia ellipsospora]|uniref:Uncharacterized protein n=1 Tax=Orbilia ellipsospora TaxID=2528407 RepID=A0AAV9X0M4_9PEZI
MWVQQLFQPFGPFSNVLQVPEILSKVIATMNASGWQFDVSSFMVLVGEGEEYNYRLMRRSVLECFAAAPIAGIQSYIHSTSSLAEATGLTYFSPSGMKSAPLRNMRLMRSIHQKSLLRDGNCNVYEIPVEPVPQRRINFSRLGMATWVLFTWSCLIGVFLAISRTEKLTWIGYTNVFGFVGCSIFLRLLDRYCMVVVEQETTDPDSDDAIFILGRRNSCFVLRGRRQDLAERTGYGLKQREGILAKAAEWAMRLSTLIFILFIFITIPNGTTSDQVAFIIVNIIGQVNVVLLQYLKSASYFSKLKLRKELKMETRTHVNGFLIREFGEGRWIDASGLLPQTPAWDAFRKTVAQYDPKDKDDREIYKECLLKA